MRLQKFGHACLLVSDGNARVLIDPGTFSSGFEQLDGLAAILVTHQHPDHLDVARLPALLERNPDAQLIADPATAELLGGDGIDATAATAGTTFDVGMRVDVIGELHAQIHPDIPQIPNVGYRIDGRLLHPGDSLTPPDDGDVEVLALPTMAPWMRMAEAIDYLRVVSPRVAVPIHEALLRSTDIFYGAFRGLGPTRTELKVLDDGAPVDL